MLGLGVCNQLMADRTDHINGTFRLLHSLPFSWGRAWSSEVPGLR